MFKQQSSYQGSKSMYHAQPAQPTPQPGTMPLMAPSHIPFQQHVPEQLLTQFHQFDDRMYARSYQNFERLLILHMTVPQNVRPTAYMPGYPQPQPHYMNPFPQSNPSIHPQFMANPTYQQVAGTYSQEGQPVMPWTSSYGAPNISTPPPSHTVPGSEPSLEIPSKRKDAMPNPEATGSKKPKHTTAFMVKREDIDLTAEQEVYSYTEPAPLFEPAKLSQTLKATMLVSIHIESSAPSNLDSRSGAKTASLQYTTLTHGYSDSNLISMSIPVDDSIPKFSPKSSLILTSPSTSHSPPTTLV